MLLLKKLVVCLTNFLSKKEEKEREKEEEKRREKEERKKTKIGILYSKKTHFLKKIIQSSKIYNLYYTYNFITK
jgi:ribosomal protein L9